MRWTRRTRAVAWGTLLMMACSVTMPSASAAFPIKEWMPPAVGDPDVPVGGNYFIKFGELRLVVIRFGGLGLVFIPDLGTRAHSRPSIHLKLQSLR